MVESRSLKLMKQTTLRGQTVRSVHCKRIPQLAKIRFVADFATLLIFFELLLLKIAPKIGKFAESAIRKTQRIR